MLRTKAHPGTSFPGKRRNRCAQSIIGTLALALGTTLHRNEATASPSEHIDDIVVTAHKEEQPNNSVGMSITTATAETLLKRGVDSVAELPRLVPGLTLQNGAFNSTSITLRGVGFFNSDLDTPPAVTVYVDEAPLTYPALTKLAAFDLARVEVLKGPQGTLFGQNATGGAVNYIAARPTDEFASGLDTSYGAFDRLQIGGFVSGPLDDHLGGRLALQVRRGDPWQQSTTRPGDELGSVDELQGRGTLEWRPSTRLTSRLTLTVTHDGSDSLAAQFIAPVSAFPALAVPGLFTFPVVTEPRSADWTPVRADDNSPFPDRSDTTLHHLAWRNDFALGEDVTLTSLTSYARFSEQYGQDQDGTPFHIGGEAIDQNGSVHAFFQELRFAGRQQRLHWLAGVNYAHDIVFDEGTHFFNDSDAAHLFQSIDPQAIADESRFMGQLHAATVAAFGRVEFSLGEKVLLETGVRYNVDRRAFDNCAFVVTDHLARFWNLFRGGAQPPTRVGDCYVVDPGNGLQPVDNVRNAVNDASTPWRLGITWLARQDVMVYANVSKGYKASAAAVLAASTTTQFQPVPEESLLAYEVGAKAGMLDHRIQLNASIFHYQYRDKQLRGSELDAIFGPLEALVSIPKSHVDGAEVQLVARPIDGLTVDTSATYLRTEIDEFIGFDALAHFGDQSGTPFPFSPTRHSNTNVDYEFAVSTRVRAFVGASLTHNSKTFSGVGALDALRIDAFTLLDLRAGVELGAGRYRLWGWEKNVRDEYYWSNTFANGNAVSRFVGQPRTFGVSLSARF